MSTITRSITIDVSTALHLREKADRFEEAAEAETRPKVAARFYKQAAFLEGEAEFYEARARRKLDLYVAPGTAGFRDYITVCVEEQNEQ